ncbi:MAG: hypothetical protein H0V47_13685 [Chloroflexia bacterium]|nr:hypothetical protein [Chloroflexia bacterium]
MHTARELTSSSFTLTVDGQEGTFADVFPDFDARDRLGIVVRQPGGALGASALILATITAFYDIQRERGSDFFVYPDYYIFHVGQSHGDHGMLDIWPCHKEVVVPDDPEELLRAINDRAITRLLVEDVAPGEHEFRRETLASVQIRTALAYSASGQAREGDVTVRGNAVTESYVEAVLDRSAEIYDEAASAIRETRKRLMKDGAVVETYRGIAVDTALSMLAPTVS